MQSERDGGNGAVDWDGSIEKKSESADIEAEIAAARDAGLSRDATVLHPQPTGDRLDPLNWSSLEKHVILAIVMFK